MIKPNTLRTSSVRLQNLWLDIWRQIQKHIEHSPMTNGDAAAVELGDVVYCSANRTITKAIGNTTLGAASAIGVVDDSTTLPGIKCLVATSGYRLVKLVDKADPAPAEGLALYVSNTAGKAGTASGANTFIIGQIGDASMYFGDPLLPTYYPYVKALINNGCCVGRGQ